MPNVVAILEDDSGRREVMRECLLTIFVDADVTLFDKSGEMIEWLGNNLGRVDLISLDHDLPVVERDGASIDCGTGREVADFLAKLAPTCPVIVHSSNDVAASGMCATLSDADWLVARVYPVDEHAWILSAWSEQIRLLIESGWIER